MPWYSKNDKSESEDDRIRRKIKKIKKEESERDWDDITRTSTYYSDDDED